MTPAVRDPCSSTPFHRSSHSAALLPDGRVLVAAGFDIGFVATAETYDPSSGTWTATGSLAEARYGHAMVQLGKGVLVVGGAGGPQSAILATVEKYDASSGTWTTRTAMPTARTSLTATLLSDGRVLVVGGENTASALSAAEIYEPTTDAWVSTAPMSTARSGHAAVLLQNGTVLVVGGASGIGGASLRLARSMTRLSRIGAAQGT